MSETPAAATDSSAAILNGWAARAYDSTTNGWVWWNRVTNQWGRLVTASTFDSYSAAVVGGVPDQYPDGHVTFQVVPVIRATSRSRWRAV